jgi:hypothetical protein
VALAAVARALHEVLAAGGRGVVGGDGDGGRVREEGELPEADAAAEAVGEGEVVAGLAAGDGRQDAEIGPGSATSSGRMRVKEV